MKITVDENIFWQFFRRLGYNFGKQGQTWYIFAIIFIYIYICDYSSDMIYERKLNIYLRIKSTYSNTFVGKKFLTEKCDPMKPFSQAHFFANLIKVCSSLRICIRIQLV